MSISLDQLEAFISSVGFPIVCITAFAYALWRCGGFLGREVLLPICRKVVEFLEHQMVCQARTADASEKMCGQITDISMTQQKHTVLLDKIAGNHVAPA